MAKKKLKLLTEQELRVKLEELKTSSDDNIKRMAREFEKALNTGFENLDLVIGAISMVILASAGMMLVEDLIIILSMLAIAIAIIPFNIIKTKLTNQKKFLRGRLKPDETVKRYYAAVDYLLACEGITDTVILESFLPEIDTCDEVIEEQVILLESILGTKVDKNKLADPEYAKQLAKQIKETPKSEYSKRENIHALIELLSILSLISVVTMPLFLLALAILPKLESNVTKEAELSKVTKCIDKLIAKCNDPEQKKKLIDNKKYFENKELVAKNIPADKNSSSKGKYINQRYYITEHFGVLSLAGCVINDIQSGDAVDFDKYDKWFKDDNYPVEWIEQLTHYQNITKILDNNKAQADAEYVENIPKLKDKHVSELMYSNGDEIIYCHEDDCCYAFNLKYIDDEPPVKISLSAIVQAASKTAADYRSLKTKYVAESVDYASEVYNGTESPEGEMEISTEAGMMFTLKSLDLIIPNVCKNAMETGRFDEIHPNLLKMVDRCRTMKDIEYLEKDLSFATLEKYAEIVEAVEKKDEIPRSINRDEIIRRIDKGVSSAKIRAHIKWLKEVYRPAIKAKKKELSSSGVNESYITTEAYFKNDEDIYYNREKFDSGEINLCFITGHSGSGKSTMGKNMAGSNIEHYELDDVVANKENFTMENFREYGDLIYSFFSGSGKKYYCTIEECRDGRFKGIDYEKELINDFVNHSIKYAKSHKNTKFVIEGIWLYLNVEPSKLKDCAVYIKGTSAVTSMIRAAKRDWSDATNGLTTIPSKIKWLVNRVTGDNNIGKAESAVQKYRSYFSKLVVTESSNMSYVNMYPVLEAPQDEDDEDTAEDFTSDVDDDEPDDDDESAEDFTNDIYDGGESPEDDTAEDDEPEDFTSDADDDGEPTEASEDGETEPVSDEGDEPVEGEEDVPEDFTDDATGEDAGEEETEGGEFDGEESTEDEDEAPADFTNDVSGEGEETPEDGEEPTTDESGETTDDMASEDPNEINLDNSSIRNYNLMIDFQKLYKNLEDILTHLNNVSYTTSIQNSVRDRCMDNLTRLKGEVYSYIDQYYSKDFKVNIYYYTTYIQALKINLEMLHKNSVMLDKDSKQ